MKNVEIRGGGAKHAKAGVMLGAENDVAEPHQPGERRPIRGMEFPRVESLGQFGEKAVCIFVGRPNQ